MLEPDAELASGEEEDDTDKGCAFKTSRSSSFLDIEGDVEVDSMKEDEMGVVGGLVRIEVLSSLLSFIDELDSS